jgi:hypothetical protein
VKPKRYRGYVPWFNMVNVGGIVASQPYFNRWRTKRSGIEMAAVHFMLFSRLPGISDGQRYERRFLVPCTVISKTLRWFSILHAGQPVLVSGSFVSFKAKDNTWRFFIEAFRAPTLLWGPPWKDTPEEVAAIIQQGVPMGEDWITDVLGFVRERENAYTEDDFTDGPVPRPVRHGDQEEW